MICWLKQRQSFVFVQFVFAKSRIKNLQCHILILLHSLKHQLNNFCDILQEKLIRRFIFIRFGFWGLLSVWVFWAFGFVFKITITTGYILRTRFFFYRCTPPLMGHIEIFQMASILIVPFQNFLDMIFRIANHKYLGISS